MKKLYVEKYKLKFVKKTALPTFLLLRGREHGTQSVPSAFRPLLDTFFLFEKRGARSAAPVSETRVNALLQSKKLAFSTDLILSSLSENVYDSLAAFG